MRFLNHGEEQKMAKGQIIFEEGKLCDGKVYYLVAGKVQLARKNGASYSSILGDHDLIDVVSPFVRDKWLFTAKAQSDVVLYSWTKESFISAVSVYQEFAQKTIGTLSTHLRDLNKKASAKKEA